MTPSMVLSPRRAPYRSPRASTTMFADGGVVTQPTDATLGENGPEAVLPAGNNPFTGPPATAPQLNQMQTNLGGTSQNQIISQAINNENNSNALGNEINAGIANQGAQYQQQQNYFGAGAVQADQALQQTPGYNAQEAGTIGQDYTQDETGQDAYNKTFLSAGDQAAMKGDPYSAMAYYNPQSLTGETQTGNQAVDDQTQNMSLGLDAAINPDLAESQGYQDSTNKAVGDESNNMFDAVTGEQSTLNNSVDPSKLGVSSDYMNQEEMTPEQQQDMVTDAGVTTGDQYRSSEDNLTRAAQASGNSSPEAIAAAQDRLQQQSGAAAGEAQAQAKIAASNAAAGRLQTATTTQLGANQAIAGMKQQNATTVGQQQLNAAATEANTAIGAAQNEENTRLGADTNIAGLQTNAATVAGQAAINAASQNEANTLKTDTANQATGEQLDAAGEAAAATRAGNVATNNQQTQQAENTNQYNQSTNSQQLNSQGQQTLGNARIAGNTQNLNFQTGEQTQAQQGNETSTGQQIQNFGTQTGAANTSTNTAGTIANSKAGQPSVLGQVLGGVSAAAGAFLEDGGVITEPTEATLGENGPEAVVPASSLQPKRTSYMGFLQNKLQNVDPNGNPIPQQPQMAPPNTGSAKQNNANQIGANLGKVARAGAQKYGGMGKDNQSSDNADDDATGGSDISSGIASGGDSGMEDLGSMFADGGVVNQPTLGTLGEAGPEAVMPLGGSAPPPPGQVPPAGAGGPGMMPGSQMPDTGSPMPKGGPMGMQPDAGGTMTATGTQPPNSTPLGFTPNNGANTATPGTPPPSSNPLGFSPNNGANTATPGGTPPTGGNNPLGFTPNNGQNTAASTPAPQNSIGPQTGGGSMGPQQPPAQTPMPPKSPFMGAPKYQPQRGPGQAPQNTMRPAQPNQPPAQAPPTAQRQPPAQGGGASAQPGARQDQMFASGGIITKPTRAILGERGPEVVVPLTPRPSNKITPSMVGLDPHMLSPKRTPYRSPRGVPSLNGLR